MELFTEIWQLVVLTTLWCVGWYMNSREPGDLLYFSRRISNDWPIALKNPLVHCINCMASLHSLVVMCLYGWATGYQASAGIFLVTWIMVAVITSGTNGILWAVYRYFEILITPDDQTTDQSGDPITDTEHERTSEPYG